MSPRTEIHLGKGDEEQLFMCVSESGQGSLWTMFPHPLLICLQSEWETGSKSFVGIWRVLDQNMTYIVWELQPSHVCDVLPQRQPPIHLHIHEEELISRPNEAAQTYFQSRDPCAQAHLLVINCEVIVEVHNAFGFRLKLPVRLLRPPLLEVPVTIILAPWGHKHCITKRAGCGVSMETVQLHSSKSRPRYWQNI